MYKVKGIMYMIHSVALVIADFLFSKDVITEEEKEERIKYRNLYMTNFRANFKNHLDSIKVKYVDENGNEIKGN